MRYWFDYWNKLNTLESGIDYNVNWKFTLNQWTALNPMEFDQIEGLGFKGILVRF